MKKITIILMLVFMAISLRAQFHSGSGMYDDPFVITDRAHLHEMMTGNRYAFSCFRLEASIDGRGIPTMGDFMGSFNGNGHVLLMSNPFIRYNYGEIYDLGYIIDYDSNNPECYQPTNDAFGAIVCTNWGGVVYSCFVYGTVTNLEFGERYVGGVVGKNHSGMIINCKSYMYIECISHSLGGIVGYNIDSEIDRCYAFGTLRGFTEVGGICGYTEETVIKNSHTYVMAYGDMLIGGIIGNAERNTRLENCYASGVVNGEIIGGIAGAARDLTIDNGMVYSSVLIDNRDISHPGYFTGAGYLIGSGVLTTTINTLLNPWRILVDTSINEVFEGQNIDMIFSNDPFPEHSALEVSTLTLDVLDIIPEDSELDSWFSFPSVEAFLSHMGLNLDLFINWECFDFDSYRSWRDIIRYYRHWNYPECYGFTPPPTRPDYDRINFSGIRPMRSMELGDEIENTILSSIKIHPNPTTGIVYIEGIEENTEITVYNLSGVVIMKTNEQTVDMTSYPKGMYIIHINGQIEKLIKK